MDSLITYSKYALAALLVIGIGAFAGWYFVLRKQTDATSAADAARGFGTTAPFANANGSTYQNSIAGVSEGSASSGSDSSKTKVPRIWHVEKTPVAGFGFSSTSELFFASRASGYIFRANPATGEVQRITNTLMPKTYQAVFDANGSVLLRTINEVGSTETFSGKVASSTTSGIIGKLIGKNLPNNIRDIVADPSTGGVFYLSSDATNPTVGLSAKWNGDTETRVFTSPLGGWRPIALKDGRRFVVQKATDRMPGYAFEVMKNGTLKSIVRAAPGLTFLPQSGTNSFLFGTSDGSLSLFLQPASGGPAITLPLKTAADKCAWGPIKAANKLASTTAPAAYCGVPSSAPQNFLSEWYQGGLHTSDALWQIDAKSGETTQLLVAHESGSDIDMIDPVVDPSGKYVAFSNAVDGSLWVFRILE